MPELLIENVGAVRVLTLNRPEKRNALNDALVGSLKTALREAGDDDDAVAAVMIRGAGKDFCSGADLSSLQKIASASFEENLEDARGLAELFALIRSLKQPVIAAVHGRALAGGCGLATACDIVLATETSRFAYPEVKIGFVPAIVMAFLRRNLSEKRAFELATRGHELSAAEASEIGLVNAVFPDEGFEQAALDYSAQYEKVSRSAVQLTKKLLYQMDGITFAEALEAGSFVNAEARMTPDCQEGIRKFLERAKT